MKKIISQPTIEPKIHVIRGQKVILDADLAAIYGVTTKRLNEQVRRNRAKFPLDFIFRLTAQEVAQLNRSHSATGYAHDENLKSQNATSSLRHGGRRKLPLAFAEHGAIMSATILNSPMAVQMSVFVVRAFVKMRTMLSRRKDLSHELALLEKKLTSRLDIHETAIVDILKRIMSIIDPPVVPPPPVPPKRPIGFYVK